jgi:oxygen-independent coproporphyrinogen-3 oxidase
MAGLYLHIPFCKKRCVYCDFFSTTDSALKKDYLEALLLELNARCDYLHGEPIETVYFGGGTPSQLSSADLGRLLEAIYRYYPVSKHPEITIEANPDDLSQTYIFDLQKLSVNRISIGIQSFNDDELRLLNRRHTAQEAATAVEFCKEAGLTNISIDLMYGLPGQTTASWLESIERALALNVSHLSAYCLTFEEGTALADMLERQVVKPIDDDLSERFFRTLIQKLTTSGFVHYEISNFAGRSEAFPEGRISLHNTSYWKGAHYLGVGPSAHSYDGISRSRNESSLQKYIQAMRAHPSEWFETEYLSAKDQYNDFVITRLRTMWGVSVKELRQRFGEERTRYFLAQSEPFFCSGLLKMKGDCVKVSPAGIYLSDAIMRETIVS